MIWKTLIASACLSLALSPLAQAQEKKEPSAAQKKQQARMKECSEKAGDMKGEERRKHMSACLRGNGPSKAQAAQQGRMKDCNRQAGEKKLKGDERRSFMSSCLKG